jgi:hypothetical protein
MSDINREKYVVENSGIVDVAKLAAPHQRVKVRNTHDVEVHTIPDRFNQPQTFQPGESREVDLLTSQIERLRELRRPGRMIEAVAQEGEVYYMNKRVEAPLHPLLIEDIGNQP